MIKLIIKPYWYIEQKTLVTILKIIKNLDEDLKRKIVSIITLRNKREEERQELIYNSYNFQNFYNEININEEFEFIQIEHYYSD